MRVRCPPGAKQSPFCSNYFSSCLLATEKFIRSLIQREKREDIHSEREERREKIFIQREKREERREKREERRYSFRERREKREDIHSEREERREKTFIQRKEDSTFNYRTRRTQDVRRKFQRKTEKKS